MMIEPTARWRCGECRTISPTRDLLTGLNPFNPDDPTDVLTACPRCKSVSEFSRICDADGCGRDGNSGMPTPGGYTWLCYGHAPRG